MKKLVTSAVLLISLFAFSSMALAVPREWKVGGPKPDFKTIQLAVNSAKVKSGDTIKVAAGEYAGAAFTKAMQNKKLTIAGSGMKKTVITSGPKLHGTQAGFYFAGFGAGTKIKDMAFSVAFPVYGEATSAISVLGVKMTNPVQGVTNWGGDGWKIQKNVITGLKTYVLDGNTTGAGGIGILIGTRNKVSALNSLVTNNKITGKVDVSSGAKPAVSGISLYADYRDTQPGRITGCKVTGNTLSIPTPKGMNVHGIGLNEAKDPAPTKHVINANTVKSNVFPLPVDAMTRVECYPEDLKNVNTITVPKKLSLQDAFAVEAASTELVNPL